MSLNNLHRLAVVVMLLIAAYLRMGQPSVVEFKRDEANLSLLALDMAQQGDIPLLGIGSSVGLPNAPVSVYILSIPYFFSTNPQLATQFIGLLNVIAVGMMYFFLRRYSNKWIALAMTLLFAVNPWAVMFSRKIWAQNMLLPFVIGTVGTGLLGYVHGMRWAKIAHLPLLAITGQIHYGAFVIIPVTLYLIAQDRKRFSREFWISAVLAVVVVLPYLIGMQRAGLLNADALSDAVQSDDGGSLSFTLQPLEDLRLLITGDEIHAFTGDRFLDFLASAPDVYWLFNLLAITFLLTFGALFLRKREPIVYIALLWLLFPVVSYLITWTPFFIHYLIPAIPAIYLILALGTERILSYSHKRKPLLTTAGGVGGFAIAAGQIIMILTLFSFVRTHHTPNGFGVPLLYLNDARSRVLEQGRDDVIADLGEQQLVFENEPTVWAVLLYDIDSLRFTDGSTRVYPSDSATVLNRDCDAENVVMLRENEGCYGISEVDGLDTTDFILLDAQPFENGVIVEAFQWENTCLHLLWRITQSVTTDYQFSVNFKSESGQSLWNGDSISWQSSFWKPEDRVIRAFCIPENADEVATVDIGMYYFVGNDDIVPLNLIDSMNNPAGRYIEIDISRSQ